MALQAVIGGVPITDYYGGGVPPLNEDQILFGAADTTIDQSSYFTWDDRVFGISDGTDANMIFSQNANVLTTTGTNTFSDNIVIGRNAGYQISGSQPFDKNIIIGHSAMTLHGQDSAFTGYGNVIMGYRAARNSFNMRGSVIIGYDAFSLTGSEGNANNMVVIGNKAGYRTTSRGSVLIGAYVGYASSGQAGVVVSTLIGYNVANNGPSNNAFTIGIGAYVFQDSNFSGDSNIAIGTAAGFGVQAGASNVLIGARTGYDLVDGQVNVFIGAQAGENQRGNGNIAIGGEALERPGTGDYNIAIGHSAMEANIGTVSGDRNIAVGYSALSRVTTGFDNIAIGHLAGATIQAQDRVVAIGDGAGSSIGRASVCIGAQSGYSGNGEKQVLIGISAGSASNGNNNVVIGFGAGSTLSSGASNVIIGYNVEPSSATASNELRIHNGIYGGNPRPLIEGDFSNRWVRFNTETRISHDTNSDEGFIARTVLTDTIDVSVSTDSSIALPAGTRVLGVSFWVINGGGVVTSGATNTWGAELTGGSTTTLLPDTTPGALNTKREVMIPDEIMSAVTEVRLVAPGAETFNTGQVNIHVYYEYLNPLG